MTTKAKIGRWSFSKHQWLALIGGISLLIWGLSGLTHVWLSLFGPQQAVFMPPAQTIDLANAKPVAQTLASAGITKPVAVRTVPSAQGTLLQVTTSPLGERRYFNPATGVEIPGQDKVQAEYLARHWLAEKRPVAAITMQAGFDEDYPWVNRQLPVWKVQFAGDEGLVAYIHTETGSLAAVSTNAKAAQQRVFCWLHTWDWFPQSAEWLRVAVVGLMVASLAALAITGIMMLVAIRRAKRLPGARGWHRVSGYVLALPLLMFSLSGIYHLVQFSLEPPVSQLRMARPLDLSSGRYPVDQDWAKLAQGKQVRGLSLLEGPQGQPLYRLDLAAAPMTAGGEHDHHAHKMPTSANAIRKARFDGLQPGGAAIYVDVVTGKPLPLADRELALTIAKRLAGADAPVTGTTLVTRFGTDYDFRNKRLPVWKVDFGAPVNASLFIDPATGVLADRVENWQKPERVVFSLIHKWNFLFPVGKLALNGIVGGATLALIVLMAGIGLWLDIRRRKQRNKQRKT